MKKINLIVIDPQNDFCLPDGALSVPGGLDDMFRLANLIDRLQNKIDGIQITLDSHHQMHIAHPMWYRNVKNNMMPDPFTIMREENGTIIGAQADSNGNMNDVGEFTTTRPSLLRWTLDYLKELNTGGRYPHCIWPPHCLIGTPGHNVVEPLMKSLMAWADTKKCLIDFVTKGSNYRTEHFSGVRAEVIDPEDPTTQLNVPFINRLMEADEILFAGEARSHCLANTFKDIANEFAGGSMGSDDSFVKKCVLLTDATSDVPTFEQYGEDFNQEMVARGMKTSLCADYLA